MCALLPGGRARRISGAARGLGENPAAGALRESEMARRAGRIWMRMAGMHGRKILRRRRCLADIPAVQGVGPPGLSGLDGSDGSDGWGWMDRVDGIRLVGWMELDGSDGGDRMDRMDGIGVA